MVKKNYKDCPLCGEQQVYTNVNSYRYAIRKKSVCNICSSVHTKKDFSDIEINRIKQLYLDGYSLSKISKVIKRNKTRIKNILIDNEIWIEGRNNRKIIFDEKIKNNIITYYKSGASCKKISKKYGVSKVVIRRVLKETISLRKPKSNGKKIILSDDVKKTIKKLYLEENKSPREISLELNKSEMYTYKHIKSCGYQRERSVSNSIALVKRFSGMNYNDYIDNLSELKKYKREVDRITNQQPINNLLNYDKRGKSGEIGAFHLDHKFSIIMGFKNNINPEIIGNIKNLEFIPWLDNIKKRTKCSIKITKLMEEYKYVNW